MEYVSKLLMDEAIENNNIDDVKEILQRSNPHNLFEKRGYIVLLKLLGEKKYDIFELLASVLDADYVDDIGDTLLLKEIGCYEHSSNNLLLILKYYKNSINAQDCNGYNLLQRAILRYNYNYHVDVHKYNPNIDEFDLDDEGSDRNLLTVIEYLLDNGADLYVKNDMQQSASDLMILHKMNNYEQFKKYNLIYINISYLMYTMQNLHYYGSWASSLYDMIEFILSRLENINEPDINGHTVLWHARNADAKPEIIELLVESGAVM